MATVTLVRNRPDLNASARVRGMAAAPTISGRRGSISKSDLLVVTTQLSIMCQSGVDLAAAISNVAQECRHTGLKPILITVSADVNGGMSASLALRKHAAVFGEAYIASVASAEASGTLTVVLKRLCELLKNEIRMRNAIIGIVMYPIVLAAVAVGIVTALVFFVLPQFSKVFQNLGRPAPAFTQLLLDSATLLRAQAHWILGIVAIIAFGLFQFSRTETWRRYFDYLVLHAPVLRDASRSLLTGRSFRLLGTLLESGVPLLESIRLCRGAIRNRLFLQLFDGMDREVTNGRGMGTEIARSQFVPPGASQMVQTAERNGQLGSVLQLIGQYYEEEGEQYIKSAMKIVEPAVIVLMGVVVGGVVMSVMLPLLDVTSAGQ
jgi:type II secretory pathway component PulF